MGVVRFGGLEEKIKKVFPHTFRNLDNISRVYLHSALDSFAMSMINIFIYTYLLQSGASMGDVFVFALVQWAIFGMSVFAVGNLICRF